MPFFTTPASRSCRCVNRIPDPGLQHIEFPVGSDRKAWDEADPIAFNMFVDPRPIDKMRYGRGFLQMMETENKWFHLRFGYQAYHGHQGDKVHFALVKNHQLATYLLSFSPYFRPRFYRGDHPSL